MLEFFGVIQRVHHHLVGQAQEICIRQVGNLVGNRVDEAPGKQQVTVVGQHDRLIQQRGRSGQCRRHPAGAGAGGRYPPGGCSPRPNRTCVGMSTPLLTCIHTCGRMTCTPSRHSRAGNGDHSARSAPSPDGRALPGHAPASRHRWSARNNEGGSR